MGGFQNGSVRLQSHQCSLNEDTAELPSPGQTPLNYYLPALHAVDDLVI